MPITGSLVKILSESDAFLGLGCLITPKLVVTCAHILDKNMSTERPSIALKIVRPLSRIDGDKDYGNAIDARVEEWFPGKPNNLVIENEFLHDLAILSLSSEFSLEQPIIPFFLGPCHAKLTFTTFGYPSGHPNGVEVTGVAKHDYNGLLQLKSLTENDYWFAPGFSGAPVVSNETKAVLGIVCSVDVDKSKKTGFAIPATFIAANCKSIAHESSPDILKWIRSLARSASFYRARIGRQISLFLKSYFCQTNNDLMPFGGRKNEFEELDSWLFGQTYERRKVIISEAGMGKSSLAVHWIYHVSIIDPRLHVIFFPVSKRFEINSSQDAFFAIAGALYNIFPEQFLDLGMTTDSRILSDRICYVLSEYVGFYPDHKFILILDGLDEAAEQDFERNILPTDIPSNLWILLTTRPKKLRDDGSDKLNALGWNYPDFNGQCEESSSICMYLQPLSRDGIAEVLAQLGPPLQQYSTREDIVDSLYLKTDNGDPLLVGMYISELWNNERRIDGFITLQNLHNLLPGLGGFIKGWIDFHIVNEEKNLLSRSEIEIIFQVLSIASAALTSEDIVGIGKRCGLHFSERNIVQKVEDFLNFASRLVVHVGDYSYIFCHPKINYYYRNILENQDKLGLFNGAIIDWEIEVFTKAKARNSPDYIPKYIYQCFAKDLVALSGDVNLFQCVISIFWARCRFKYDGSFLNYIEDLNTIISSLISFLSDRKFVNFSKCLSLFIQSVLSIVSIRNQGSNFSNELLKWALKLKVINDTTALHYLCLKTSAEQVVCLSELVRYLTPEGIKYAYDLYQNVKDFPCFIQTNILIANNSASQFCKDICDEVLSRINFVKNPVMKFYYYYLAIPLLPSEYQVASILDALLITKNIIDKESANGARKFLAYFLSKNNGECLIDKIVLELKLNKFSNKKHMIIARCFDEIELLKIKSNVQTFSSDVVLTHKLSISPDGNSFVIRESFADSACRKSEDLCDSFFLNDFGGKSEHRSRQEIEDEIDKARYIGDRHAFVRLIFILMLKCDNIDHEALSKLFLEQFERIGEAISKKSVCLFVLEFLCEKIKGALNLTDPITVKNKCSSILEKLSFFDESFLSLAIDVVSTCKNGETKSLSLAIISHFIDDDLKQKTLDNFVKSTMNLSDAKKRSEVFLVSGIMWDDEQKKYLLDKAIDSALMIEEIDAQFIMLLNISMFLSVSNRNDVVSRALSFVSEINDEPAKAFTLCQIIDYLSGDFCRSVVKIIETINEEDVKILPLSKIIKLLPSHSRKDAIDDILDKLSDVYNAKVKVDVLNNIAGFVSDDKQLDMEKIVLPIIYEIKWPIARGVALASIASWLSPEGIKMLFPDILTSLRSIENKNARLEVINMLMDSLSADKYPQIFPRLLDELGEKNAIFNDGYIAEMFKFSLTSRGSFELENICLNLLKNKRDFFLDVISRIDFNNFIDQAETRRFVNDLLFGCAEIYDLVP